MKKNYTILFLTFSLFFFTKTSQAQTTQTGDLAVVGFCADSTDFLAMVALATIPANSTFYLRDDEWNGTAFNTGEGTLSWNIGTNAIAVGTIIRFNALAVDTLRNVSVGTITRTGTGTFDLSGSNDALYCYQGSDQNTPSHFICAIINGVNFAAATASVGTGLTEGGGTAVTLGTTALPTPDMGAYKGTRTGLTKDAFLAAIGNLTNWDIEDGSGNQSANGITPDLPFSNTSFTLGNTAATPDIKFEAKVLSQSEATTTFGVAVNIVNPNGQPSTVRVVLSPRSQATNSQDLTFVADTTLTFSGDTTTAARRIVLNIPITNDNAREQDEYFILTLRNATNANITADSMFIGFIQDNDQPNITPTNELRLNQIASYSNGISSANSAEIVAYEKNSKRLFLANSVAGKIDIVDFRTPSVPTAIRSIEAKGINSIAIQNGVIVAALEDTLNKTAAGRVIFLDTAGTILKTLTVGALPDMVAISPDNKYVLTANEGEPNNTYTEDPEGSVSIIDIQGGVANLTQNNVRTVSFATLNPQKAALKAAGVRIFGRFGNANDSSSVAQDLEPEYITFSDNSKYAYVSLQENNAIAAIDVLYGTLVNYGQNGVLPLGLKDHNIIGNGIDASDKGSLTAISNWKVKGMYMPDAIAQYSVGGQSYIVTANEGDAREYSALTEEARVSALRLDPTQFPDSTALKQEFMLGRLTVSKMTGDTDGDGDFDELHVLGGRSFSIWNATTGALVWDSGEQFERITRDSAYFNASNSSTITRRDRSDNKGPEPEGVAIATLGGKKFAFIALERTGGVMVYNVTNPTAPNLVTYTNNRNDRGPEGIIVIPSAESPNGRNLLLLACEISSTVAVYDIDATTLPTTEIVEKQTFSVYPNPSVGNEIFFSRALSGRLVSLTGQTVSIFKNQNTLNVSDLANGVYFIIGDGFVTQKIVIQK